MLWEKEMIENLDRKTIEIVLSRIAIDYKKGRPERGDYLRQGNW